MENRKYPINTPLQLKAVLKGLRKSKHLTQAQVGQALNVNQRRASSIENNPGATSFTQLSRLVSILGGRIVIELKDDSSPKTSTSDTR